MNFVDKRLHPTNGDHVKVYLDVSYDEKDKAKKLGAIWDSSMKMWCFMFEIEKVLECRYGNIEKLKYFKQVNFILFYFKSEKYTVAEQTDIKLKCKRLLKIHSKYWKEIKEIYELDEKLNCDSKEAYHKYVNDCFINQEEHLSFDAWLDGDKWLE